jgi:16S rRNA processing protein RimM
MPVATSYWRFCLDTMDLSQHIKIGYVSKTHGLKGEVTFQLSADAPEPEVGQVLMFEKNGAVVPHFVKEISINGAKAFVKLEDVNTFEAAGQLKGNSIYLEKSKRPKLKRGEFYDDELVGFAVHDAEAGKLGIVNRVENQGLNKLLDVGEKNVLIPVNGPFITSISKAKKRIDVELPEGFLDI